MIFHIHWRPAFFCLAACAFFTTTAQAQDKVHLQSGHAVGDVSDNETVLEMNLTMKITADGRPIPDVVTGDRTEKKFQESVLAVGADGKPSAIVRSYSLDHVLKTQTGQPDKLEPASIEGKMVTVRRADGKVTATMTPGEISAADQKDLKDALESLFDGIYPDHDLAVGEAWTVDAATLARSFPNSDKATLTGKLLEVVSYKGHRCAHLQINLNPEAPPPGAPEQTPAKPEIKLSGEVYHALDMQRPLFVLLSGPLTLKNHSKQQGHDIAFVGTGTLKMEMTTKWLRVADKAPPQFNEPAK